MELLRENRPLSAAVVIGGGITVIVSTLPFVRFAYDNPALHLALETGEGLIACLLTYLALERYPPGAGTRPTLVGHPLVFCIQLLTVALYAGAAAGFTRQARSQATSCGAHEGRPFFCEQRITTWS